MHAYTVKYIVASYLHTCTYNAAHAMVRLCLTTQHVRDRAYFHIHMQALGEDVNFGMPSSDDITSF